MFPSDPPSRIFFLEIDESVAGIVHTNNPAQPISGHADVITLPLIQRASRPNSIARGKESGRGDELEICLVVFLH